MFIEIMKKNKLFYVITIILFLIAPPSSLAEMKPDWVNGKNRFYPEEHYLVGVGYGDTRETAEKNAYAAISKIFSANITSISKDYERYSQVKSIGKTEIEDEINIEQFTEITTGKILENVTVVETWYESVEKVYYVLAVIDRAKAENSLKEKITSLDLQINKLVEKARNTTDKIQKIRNLKDAIDNFIKRDLYNGELRIVKTSGKGIESPIALIDIKGEMRKFLTDNFVVSVKVFGDKSGDIKKAIIEGLNRQGLSVVKSDRNEDLIVKGDVEFKKVDIHDSKYKFIRWTANFKLINKHTDKIIGSINRFGREGHLTLPEAETRALMVLQKEIVNEISKKLSEFIYGRNGE